MNKVVLLSCVFGMLAVAAVNSAPQYESKFDSIDLDNVLASRRLVQGYVNCILGEGPCTAAGTYLATVLPGAIETNCAQCSDKQKVGAKKVLVKVMSDYPEEWKRVAAKFDPTGERLKAFLG